MQEIFQSCQDYDINVCK